MHTYLPYRQRNRMASLGKHDDPELLWAKLPSEVQTAVLGWLPLRSLFRFKHVCKSWNSAISSPSFVHFPSRISSRYRDHPWLVFFSLKIFDYLLAFDFDAFSWFKFDVGFLPDMLNVTLSPSDLWVRPMWCIGSGSGLLLLDLWTSQHVCNPLTKSLVTLPPFKCIEVVTRGFSTSKARGLCKCVKTDEAMPSQHDGTSSMSSVGSDGDAEEGLIGLSYLRNNSTERHSHATELSRRIEVSNQNVCCGSRSPHYTVVVIGQVNMEPVIEVYCSSRNSWEIVGSVPSTFIISVGQMLECDGLFYTLLLQPTGMLVVGKSVDAGMQNWRIQAIPWNNGTEVCRLLACQNSIYMVCPVDVNQNGVAIWQYQSLSSSWIKQNDMPDYILQDVNSISKLNWVDCIGVGHHLCFRARGTLNVLTYNLCDGVWRWLPVPSHEYDVMFSILPRALEFEPWLYYMRSL